MVKKIILTVGVFFVATLSLHAEDGTQQFEGFNLSGYTDQGEKTWDVKGDTADVKGNMITINNIVANAYGEQAASLTANSGTIDQTSGTMHLQDDVVITSETGATIKTDSLDWKKEEDLVTTKDKAVMNDLDKGINVVGTGLIAHPNLQTAQMNEDVTVKVLSEKEKIDGKLLTITCDGPLEIDQAKQQAIFNNNVVAQQEGRMLKADRLEIYFDEATKQIHQLVCIGNVAVTQGENTTYAEKAVYNASDRKLVLSGRPKLILQTEGEQGIAPFGN